MLSRMPPVAHRSLSRLRAVAAGLGVSRRGLTFTTAQREELARWTEAVRQAAGEAAPLPPPAPLAPAQPSAETVPSGYVEEAPHPQTALDLFTGAWASQLPDPWSSLQAGTAPLFEDGRVTWALEVLGPVAGRTVLELGPLECGHTYMLDRAGAHEVVAVEANRHAYLRCLVVKELVGLPSARLLLGDFVRYLEQRPSDGPAFHLAFASGVLYHMADPLHLLELLARHSDRLVLWTHVYDDALISARPELLPKFPGSTSREWRGETYTYHRQEYQAALQLQGFCGGPAPHSNWLTRADLLRAVDRLGFDVVGTAFEHDDHPNGPALALAARRRGADV